MPRLYRPPSDDGHPGTLAIETPCEYCFDVFYLPSKERLLASGLAADSPDEHRVRLLQIDCGTQSLSMFPIRTRPHFDGFLKPKYPQIQRITIEAWEDPIIFRDDREDLNTEDDEQLTMTEDDVVAFLERLPSGFVSDYDYGLGLTQRYRFIVNTVEELSDCTEIVISPFSRTEVDEEKKIFHLSLEDFNTIRKSIDSTIDHSQSAARSVNYAATRNVLAERLGQPPVPVRTGRSPLRKMITEATSRGENSLSPSEQDEVLGVLRENTKSIAMTKPDKLATLKNDIELVTLEKLIEDFEQMIHAKVPERKWQNFLEANSFILSLAFGYPVLKVQGQASVGGHKLSGAGETIADFLVKNSLTNNSAIVEIKTPGTALLKKTAYRGETYPPSGHLVGAVNQVLNQKHSFEGEIARIKNNSRTYDLESYSVRCCLIIGTMPTDEERKKSFELFRGNSKNVEIVTFDELLEKLWGLRDLLTPPQPPVATKSELVELPF